MSFAIWALIIGAILIIMALIGTLVERLPMSPGMIYLAIGYALGPAGWALMTPDPFRYSAELERMAEVALLISLFAVGLKLGVPLRDKRWYLPLRLAFPSMALTVLSVAAIGMFLLGLPAGAAVLLAAILAPTDPVLASDVQVEDSSDRDRLRFSLTAEGGLNDGTAFPFVLFALGMLGLLRLRQRLALACGRRVLGHRGRLGDRWRPGGVGREAGPLSAHAAPGGRRPRRVPGARPDRDRLRRRTAHLRVGLSRGICRGTGVAADQGAFEAGQSVERGESDDCLGVESEQKLATHAHLAGAT